MEFRRQDVIDMYLGAGYRAMLRNLHRRLLKDDPEDKLYKVKLRLEIEDKDSNSTHKMGCVVGLKVDMDKDPDV